MSWISVEDRLPMEIADLVLVARESDHRCALPARFIDGQFHVCDGFTNFGGSRVFVNPTHWMLIDDVPLPPPPEASE